MKAGVDDSSTHVLLIIFQHWEASTDKKRRGPACHTALLPPLAETLPDDDSFLPPPCAWGAGLEQAEPGRCRDAKNRAQEPQTPLKGGTCLFSETGPFL